MYMRKRQWLLSALARKPFPRVDGNLTEQMFSGQVSVAGSSTARSLHGRQVQELAGVMAPVP